MRRENAMIKPAMLTATALVFLTGNALAQTTVSISD
jgi:hypothetical protein